MSGFLNEISSRSGLRFVSMRKFRSGGAIIADERVNVECKRTCLEFFVRGRETSRSLTLHFKMV